MALRSLPSAVQSPGAFPPPSTATPTALRADGASGSPSGLTTSQMLSTSLSSVSKTGPRTRNPYAAQPSPQAASRPSAGGMGSPAAARRATPASGMAMRSSPPADALGASGRRSAANDGGGRDNDSDVHSADDEPSDALPPAAVRSSASRGQHATNLSRDFGNGPAGNAVGPHASSVGASGGRRVPQSAGDHSTSHLSPGISFNANLDSYGLDSIDRTPFALGAGRSHVAMPFPLAAAARSNADGGALGLLTSSPRPLSQSPRSQLPSPKAFPPPERKQQPGESHPQQQQAYQTLQQRLDNDSRGPTAPSMEVPEGNVNVVGATGGALPSMSPERDTTVQGDSASSTTERRATTTDGRDAAGGSERAPRSSLRGTDTIRSDASVDNGSSSRTPHSSSTAAGLRGVTIDALQSLVTSGKPCDVPCPPGFSFTVYSGDISKHFVLKSSHVQVTRGSIKYVDHHTRYGAQTRFRFQLCHNYLLRKCPKLSECSYIHATQLPAPTQVHLNPFAPRRLAADRHGRSNDVPYAQVDDPAVANSYECMPPGATYVVFPPHGNQVTQLETTVPSDSVIRTAGADEAWRYMLKPSDAPSGYRPRHCAHFQFKRVCNLGNRCSMIHSKVPFAGTVVGLPPSAPGIASAPPVGTTVVDAGRKPVPLEFEDDGSGAVRPKVRIDDSGSVGGGAGAGIVVPTFVGSGPGAANGGTPQPPPASVPQQQHLPATLLSGGTASAVATAYSTTGGLGGATYMQPPVGSNYFTLPTGASQQHAPPGLYTGAPPGMMFVRSGQPPPQTAYSSGPYSAASSPPPPPPPAQRAVAPSVVSGYGVSPAPAMFAPQQPPPGFPPAFRQQQQQQPQQQPPVYHPGQPHPHHHVHQFLSAPPTVVSSAAGASDHPSHHHQQHHHLSHQHQQLQFGAPPTAMAANWPFAMGAGTSPQHHHQQQQYGGIGHGSVQLHHMQHQQQTAMPQLHYGAAVQGPRFGMP